MHAYGHVHEGLLLKTANDIGVTLTGQLEPCTGCSMAKGLRKGISSSTHVILPKKLGKHFVDRGGSKRESDRKKEYTLTVLDDFKCMTWVYILAVVRFSSFQQMCARTGSYPLSRCFRSDSGGDFERHFPHFCRIHGIKLESIAADSLEFYHVAERALGLVDAAARATVVQAR